MINSRIHRDYDEEQDLMESYGGLELIILLSVCKNGFGI